jgi:hypothetical protein
MAITIAFRLSGVIHMGLVAAPKPMYAGMRVYMIRRHVAGFYWLQPVAIVAEVGAKEIVGCMSRRSSLTEGSGRD